MDDSSSVSHGPPITHSNGVEAARTDLLDISTFTVVAAAEEPAPVNGTAASSHQDDDLTDPQLQISNEEDDNLHVVLAMNEAMSELIDNMILKAEDALRVNREKQKVLEERKKALSSASALTKRKVPVSMFMPPYFKDQFDMCPPQNAELKRKMECMLYDPLLKPERVWTAADLRTMHDAVRDAMLDERLMPLYAQRELLQEKIRAASATTTPEERKEWAHKLDAFNRKIDYEKTLTDRDLLTGDYRNVDWAKIAMVHFKGLRTPMSICLKWTNEQSPQWNKEPWTVSEVKRLHELSRADFISWSLIADKLGTRRTPWQCFEKFKSELSNETLKREWTQDEDDRLVKLVESLQLNGVIMWDKVTYHMVGRTRQQCRNRYLRTLDKSIKHGRWTDEEDLLLMCSIGRYGAKDWRKIAKGVPGRNDAQCRERWVNVLDRANRSEEWSMEEDEKLLYAVNMFGKGRWAQVATVIPGRNQRACKARFRSLLTTRMRICAAQLSRIREEQEKRRGASRCHLKRRSEATFKEFNQLVGGNDETGESFCNRARSVALADAFRFKQIEPEVARVVEEGMHGISKKYERRDRRGEVNEDGHTQELFENIEASGRKTWLPVEFDPEESEEYKCQRLTEALCQVVGGLDQLRAVSQQEAHDVTAKSEVEWRLRRLLIEAVDARVAAAMSRDGRATADEGPMTSKAAARQAQLEESIRCEMRAAADAAANDMLHPTAGTVHAAELLIAELPRLEEVVRPLVSIPWGGERVHSTEEMLARLEDQLKHNKEFIEMKEILRCLLIEPFQLTYSLEDDDRQIASLTEQFNSMRDQLLADVNKEVVDKNYPKSARKKTPPTKKQQQQLPKNMRLADILATLPPAPPPTSVSVASFELDTTGPKQKTSSSRSKKRQTRSSSVWDDNGSDDELPIDWEEEEPAAAPTSSKKPPAKRRASSSMSGLVKEEKSVKRATRSTRNSMPRTPAPSEEEDEEEAVEPASPPAKKSRGRGRKSATPAAKEKTTVAKETAEEKQTPAKRGRGRPTKAPKSKTKDTVDEATVVAAASEENTVEETEEGQKEASVPREDTVKGEEQEKEEEATVATKDTVEPVEEEGQKDAVDAPEE